MGCCQGIYIKTLVLVIALACCYGVSRVMWVVVSVCLCMV